MSMLFTVGLVAPFLTQPGLQLSLETPLSSAFVRPQLGVWARADEAVTGSVDVELGVRRASEGRMHPAASLGLGYQVESQVVSRSVPLGGEVGVHTRDVRHYAVPTLNGELAFDAGSVQIVPSLAVGRRIRLDRAGETFAMVELGVRFGGGR